MLAGPTLMIDGLAPVSPYLIEDLSIGRAHFGLLHGAAAGAGVLAALFAGHVIERIGLRPATFLFSLLALVGAVMIVCAPGFGALLAARLVFGVGFEGTLVAEPVILASRFTRRFGFAHGMTLMVYRIGGVLSFATFGVLAVELSGWRAPLLLAAGVCLFSTVCATLYVCFASRGERSRGAAVANRELPASADQTEPVVSQWTLISIAVLYYTALGCFLAFAPDLLRDAWGFSATDIGLITGLMLLASVVAAPFSGLLLDRLDRGRKLLALGLLVTLAAFTSLVFSLLPPALPMLALGLAFALVPTILWAMMRRAVPPARAGRAFGAMIALINLTLAVSPPAIGWLRDHSQSYQPTLAIFALLSGVALWLAHRSRQNAASDDRPQLG